MIYVRKRKEKWLSWRKTFYFHLTTFNFFVPLRRKSTNEYKWKQVPSYCYTVQTNPESFLR